MAGRKSKLTPEVEKIILETLRIGATFEAAAGRAGVSVSAINEWRRRGHGGDRRKPSKAMAAFATAVDRALADAETSLVGTVRKASSSQWQAAAWLLERRCSTLPETWSTLMAGQVAEMIWCDPPYGVKYEGKTKDKLKIQNDDLPPDQLGLFIRAAIDAACGVLKPGGALYVAGPAGPLGVEFKRTMIEMGVLRQELQWVKDVFVMGRSDYHYRHEPILYGWKVGASHRWYGGRAQDSILNCPRPHRSKVHPTMKPTALIRRCIENNSRVGEIVIDGFGGSGSTLIASALCGREARLVELDPGYCDVIRARWTRWAIAHQQEPGEGAIL